MPDLFVVSLVKRFFLRNKSFTIYHELKETIQFQAKSLRLALSRINSFDVEHKGKILLDKLKLLAGEKATFLL